MICAWRHPLFWRSKFSKVFNIYEHGGHLGQWTTTILTIFHSPAPRRLQMKYEQHWPRGFRWGHLKFSTFSPYKCMVTIQMHREANLTSLYKAQMPMYNHYFGNFGRPPIPDDLCKDSAPRHPWFWRRFLKVFTIYGHGGHLGQQTVTIFKF